MPDGAVGDIVCVADKFKRVVARDWNGYLHRARKERLVKPSAFERKTFCVGRPPASVQLDENFQSRYPELVGRRPQGEFMPSVMQATRMDG